jgi:hypothetical protein
MHQKAVNATSKKTLTSKTFFRKIPVDKVESFSQLENYPRGTILNNEYFSSSSRSRILMEAAEKASWDLANRV